MQTTLSSRKMAHNKLHGSICFWGDVVVVGGFLGGPEGGAEPPSTVLSDLFWVSEQGRGSIPDPVIICSPLGRLVLG